MDTYHVADAEAAVFELFRRANKYIDETSPWALAKDPEQKGQLGTVMYYLQEVIRFGAVLLHSFLPGTADRIFAMLNTDCRELTFGGLTSGTQNGKSEILFGRLDDAVFAQAQQEAQKAEEAPKAESAAKPEGLAQIGIDDFSRVELRTAQVIACEPVPKTKKLLRLQLDLGYEQRQVVSGIAPWYRPDELIGKKLIVVANLKPAKLAGVESNGMILASGEQEARVVFLADDVPLGDRIH